MIVELLTEHNLEFLSLTRGCRGSSESTLVKMSNCWKSHAAAHLVLLPFTTNRLIRCQLPVATLFAKSLRCVNRTRSNKEIMITMRDIWNSNLEG